MSEAENPPADDVVVVDHDEAGRVEWRFERAFFASGWECLWGRGCRGILDDDATELEQGCCSLGAEFADEDDARLVAASAALLGRDEAQFHDRIRSSGPFRDERRDHTAVVDGACVFFNRPGFPGGTGCALHLAAQRRGESVLDWKPAVCWQVPFRVRWNTAPDGDAVVTVRRWGRADWGPGGAGMAWCCTDPVEAPEAFGAPTPVALRLRDELVALAGPTVADRLAAVLGDDQPEGVAAGGDPDAGLEP